MLARCVGSRRLPPRRVALRRGLGLGLGVAERRSGHDTLLVLDGRLGPDDRISMRIRSGT